VAEYDALAQCFDALKGALETNNNSFLPFSDCVTKYCVAEIREYARGRESLSVASTMVKYNGGRYTICLAHFECDLFAGVHGGCCIYISVSGDAPRK